MLDMAIEAYDHSLLVAFSIPIAPVSHRFRGQAAQLQSQFTSESAVRLGTDES